MNRNKKSSWNKGLHTPEVQLLLDEHIIWCENNIWYRKCPTCQRCIPSRGEYALHGCVRLYRDKRTCKSCGKKRTKQNLIGKPFGKLVVIAEAPKHKNDPSPYWKCKCECGNETEVRAHTLTSHITKTCGGLHHRTGAEHYKWKGYGEISGRYIGDLKKHAVQLGLPFNLPKEEMWKQFIKQNKYCALTGRPLVFCSGKNMYDTTASLDRIDSTKGYVRGNVQWVHKDINWFKRDYPQDKFLEMCKEISDYTSKSKQ